MSIPEPAGYCGRFAPSPTGPLHFGSLIAALGSYLDARRAGGRWLVRIEDLDTPRSSAAVSAEILRTLERLGLSWDGEVAYQSARTGGYQALLERLAAHSYGCACSRKEIADSMLQGAPRGAQPGPLASRVAGDRRYPGTCRAGVPPGRAASAIRVRTEPGIIHVQDAVQGSFAQDVYADVGDFVIQRADGVFAYQLAVVADDDAQGITDVVRGADLLASTPRQIHLQRLLGLATPRYKHLPVVTTVHGEKLSKQTRARPITGEHPAEVLVKALRFLGQEPPAGLEREGAEAVLSWAVRHWSLERVPPVPARPVDDALEPLEPVGGRSCSM